MARTLTINSVTPTPNGQADVSFTMAGMAISAMNKTYTVNLPNDTLYDLIKGIRAYLTSHAQGLGAVQAVATSAAITAIVATPTDVDAIAITPGV